MIQSPSSWRDRLPVLILALSAFAVSIYLALYQWHVVGGTWDPIFGSRSSERVLDSSLSRSLPVPDAAFGATAYAVEAFLAGLGSTSRWRALAWVVLLYGATAAVLAVTSLLLLSAQALLVGHGCTLCFLSASISFVNVWLAHHEVMATVRALRDASSQRHERLWRLLANGI